jgi:hypothetical protein
LADSEGLVLAVVYEASDGWHTDVLDDHLNQADTDFKNTVDLAIERLSHWGLHALILIINLLVGQVLASIRFSRVALFISTSHFVG